MLDLRQKASAAGAPQRELTAFVTRKLDKSWKAQAYVVKGFADGSPDWGAALTWLTLSDSERSQTQCLGPGFCLLFFPDSDGIVDAIVLD